MTGGASEMLRRGVEFFQQLQELKNRFHRVEINARIGP
jgi:hypothetical protein